MKEEEKFVIKAYSKSELAMLYFPKDSTNAAMKKFRKWLILNPRLRKMVGKKTNWFTPKQVQNIVNEVGEPFDL